MPLRCLVIGGARSGKSRYAESRVAALGGRLVYVATAEPRDAEMRARIAHHRTRRGAVWQTIEEPIHLPEAIDAAAVAGAGVLVDCLTLWLNNLLDQGHDPGAAGDRLQAALARAAGNVVVVANEVGLGIVPDNPLARRFRDAAGQLNQRLAALADEAVFMAAGLPLTLKSPGTTGGRS